MVEKMTEAHDEALCKQDNIAVTVVLNMVKIEIACSDSYEAQILFDDITSRFEAGQTISIEPCRVALNPKAE